jgi:hypothetical protein
MGEPHRPGDYIEYRDAAAAILACESGDAALTAFGLGEILHSTGHADLTPLYAFLEAQGAQVAVTAALGRLGTVGLPRLIDGPGPPPLLGQPLGDGALVAVPGLLQGAPVAVDRPGAGLVLASGDRVHLRTTPEPVADDYLVVVELDPTAEVVVSEEELVLVRPAVLARTQLGAAAELLGMCGRMIDDAVAHSRLRRQFGSSLSGFQAVQHLLAWAATERYQLATMFDIAVERAAATGPDPVLSSAVKALAGRVVHAVVQAATQVTGAMSFTWEYRLRRLHHRALALEQFAGSSADLIADLGQRLRAEGTLPELFGFDPTETLNGVSA